MSTVLGSGVHVTDPWGTIPAWVSAIGSTLAFFSAVYVIRRDARIRRFAQARKINLYATKVTKHPSTDTQRKHYSAEYVVENRSDETVYDVTLWCMSRSGLSRDVLTGSRMLLPDDKISREWLHRDNQIELDFRDNLGQTWARSYNGQLRELNWRVRLMRRIAHRRAMRKPEDWG
jgi:hypothetical protein